jgi:YD repeat-containing protein
VPVRRRVIAGAAVVLLLGGSPLSGIAPSPVRAGSFAPDASQSAQGVINNADLATPSSTHDVSLSTPWTAFDGNVNVVGGNLSFGQLDLTIPSIGFATTVARAYDSAAATVDGPFGYGWFWSYGLRIATAGDGVDVVRADGRVDHYTSVSSSYTPPVGIYDTLATVAGGGWTLTLVDQTTYLFGADGRLTSQRDPNGNALTLTYTGGLVSGLTDTAGRAWTFLPAADGVHVGEVDDPTGRKVNYSYAGAGDLTGVTDAAGGSQTLAYASHSLTSRTDANGHAISYVYGAGGRVSTVTDALSHTTSFSYDGVSLRTTVTDPRGPGRRVLAISPSVR